MIALVAAFVPLLVSLLFAGAIDRIRRQRPEAIHAHSWSAAFSLLAAGWFATLIVLLMAWEDAGREAAAGLCWLGAALIFVHGLRQRARRTNRAAVLAAIWTAIAIGMALLLDIDPGPLAVTTLVPLLEAVGLLVAAVAVRPRHGTWNPLDAGAIGLLALIAFAKILQGVLVAFLANTGPASVLPSALIATPFYVALGVAAMMLLNQDLAAALHRLARLDELTGVWNRRGFDEASTYLLARSNTPVAAVAIADIDSFKGINDRHGHAIGDAALVRFARLLGQGVERGDLLARLGGEEFALLAFDTTGPRLFERLERIRSLVMLPDAEGLPQLTASFGVAELDPRNRSLRDALERADRALYRAKHEGRNRTILGEPPVSLPQ